MNEPIKLKPTPDGKRQGKVQVRKKYLDRAKIRIITLSVDGKPQVSGGAFYDIPIKKYLKKSPTDASPASSAAPASNPSPN